MKKVLVIAGPTASGKTELSLSVAAELGGEIVSADSMQIYRGMDIGTAKATPEEQAVIPHHMIDVVDPSEDYSVSRYVDDAAACCEDILSRGKLPVITGGTGLYIDSLLSGRNFEAGNDPDLRLALNEKYTAIGGEAMLRELSDFDPDRAAILHPSDMKRIVRAFEVYLLSGETITEHDRRTKELPPRYDALFIIPGFSDRQLLYDRINSRVDRMFEEGLVDEVRNLLNAGVPDTCTAMQAIGYKETVGLLRGELTPEETSEQIKLASRRYAKRQITWFARRKDALRLNRDEFSSSRELTVSALRAAKEFIDDK